MTEQPTQYGGHDFRWSGSWLLPECSRCGRRSETDYDPEAPHQDGWSHSPPHTVPCTRLGHFRYRYPTCDGNKIAVLEEERERAHAAYVQANDRLVNVIERLQAERAKVEAGG